MQRITERSATPLPTTQTPSTTTDVFVHAISGLVVPSRAETPAVLRPSASKPRTRRVVVTSLLALAAFVILYAVASLPVYQLAYTMTRIPSFKAKLRDDVWQGKPGRPPMIIHQTWKNERVPERFREMRESWMREFPEARHVLWTDEDNRRLVAENYSWFLEEYDRLPMPIMRVDAARLFILYEFGGLYTDLDIACAARFVDLWGKEGVVVETTPLGITNAFLLFERRHPFVWQAIQALRGASERPYLSPYWTVMFNTGPTWLTHQYLRYTNNATLNEEHPIHVVSLERWRSGNYTRAIHGNTWHSWDAELAKFLFSALVSRAFLLGVLLPVLGLALLLPGLAVLRRHLLKTHPSLCVTPRLRPRPPELSV